MTSTVDWSSRERGRTEESMRPEEGAAAKRPAALLAGGLAAGSADGLELGAA
ncbi:hypothetical protein [Nigerium sp.]|jgi:hypothetical protein|uniref:hypothetical protein n=1 Tax=Nigerium sp. TaxID=2042655 RepID=UPI0032213FB4